MDWHYLATYLFGQLADPAILVDKECCIGRINRAAQQAYGWSRHYVGQSLRSFVRPLSVDCDMSRLFEHFGGAQDAERVLACEAEVQTSSGHWVRSGAEIRRFGDSDPMYLVQLGASLTTSSTMPPAGLDLVWTNSPDVVRFDIDTSPFRFGTITRAEARGGATETWVGRRCYATLHGRSSPCRRCPAANTYVANGIPPATESDSRTDIISIGKMYCMVRSRTVRHDMAHISERSFEEGLVSQLVGARLEALAEAAALSEREGSVFELLVLGRTLDEIANVLGISNRTVRFHQSNLLDKLGADSRVDLMRILL